MCNRKEVDLLIRLVCLKKYEETGKKAEKKASKYVMELNRQILVRTPLGCSTAGSQSAYHTGI